jgi:hypothetical protein
MLCVDMGSGFGTRLAKRERGYFIFQDMVPALP